MSKKTKEQHYVPRMYLKHFADKDKKCYTLNSNGEIHPQKIKEICKKTNIYELKKEDGSVVQENLFEKGYFREMEEVFSPFLEGLFQIFDNANKTISLSSDDEECLLGFVAFLFLRNPCVINATRKAAEQMGVVLTEREAHNAAIFNTAFFLRNRINYFKNNYNLLIHRNNTKSPFVTSGVPISFLPLSTTELRFWYIPLSTRYLVELVPKKVSAFSDLHILDIKEEKADYFNRINWLFCLKLTDSVLITSDQALLERYRKEYYVKRRPGHDQL